MMNTANSHLQQRYRETAAAVVTELTRHEKVIGVAICGSLVRGDLWEHSDVDMFVVMRDVQSDWHALTVRHGDVDVHLQVISEDFLLCKSESFRGSLVSQALSLSEVLYDPEDLVTKGIRDLATYPESQQVHNAIKHLIHFLSSYNRAEKCLLMGFTEDAVIHLNTAFSDLAQVEYARLGRFPQRAVMEELVDVSPNTYKAYVWFVHGRKKVRERIRRSFAFFERILAEILNEMGPPLIAAIRAQERPVTEEGIGQIPAVYDQSADLKLLIGRLVRQNMIREDGRALEVEGVPIRGLSEMLFDLF